MFAEIKASLHGFGVDFDVYFRETLAARVRRRRQGASNSSSTAASSTSTTVPGGCARRDSATTRTASSSAATDSLPTSPPISPTIADKRARGFDLCIFLLGADHHGYIGRLKAAAAALGDDPDAIEVLIGQIVRLVRDGKPASGWASARERRHHGRLRRRGRASTRRDTRWCGARSTPRSTSMSTCSSGVPTTIPVFYVQYAHARLSSLTAQRGGLGIVRSPDPDLGLLTHEREIDLLGALGEFPRVVASAAELRAPHRVARYLEELAGVYHRFYDACRVLPQGDEEPTSLTHARLWLCEATRVVLANGLGCSGSLRRSGCSSQRLRIPPGRGTPTCCPSTWPRQHRLTSMRSLPAIWPSSARRVDGVLQHRCSRRTGPSGTARHAVVLP